MWKFGRRTWQSLSKKKKLIKKVQDENEKLKGSTSRLKSQHEKLQNLR
jgi:cell division protein FtsB